MTRPAAVTRHMDFALSDLTVRIIEVEGTVQLVYSANGWPVGTSAPIANQFCDPGTAAQLRAVADHLDTINWRALSAVAAG